MLVFQMICFVVWAYIVWTLARADLKFYKFVVGSVGTFIFLLLWVEGGIVGPLTKLVAYVSGLIGSATGIYDSYYEYSMLFIPKSTSAVSLYVDFECSGVIETMAFVSLLWFFDLYNFKEKFKWSVLGTLYIFVSNVIRIFVICLIIYWGGNDWFYFAHSIFGRIIFYALTIVLYFHVFTREQIIRQRVGNFSYEGDEKVAAASDGAANTDPLMIIDDEEIADHDDI